MEVPEDVVEVSVGSHNLHQTFAIGTASSFHYREIVLHFTICSATMNKSQNTLSEGVLITH